MNRYAARLLDQALAAFAVASVDARSDVLPLLDVFLATPGPITFLKASHGLVELRRNAQIGVMSRRVAGRVFERAQRALAAVDGVDAGLLEALQALPVDEHAGARLHALAHMLTAFQELAGRSEAHAHALRKQFQAVKAKGAAAAGKRKPPARLGA